MPKIGTVPTMDQEIIATVGYAKNGTLTKKVLLLCSLELLLPSELHNLSMRIGVLCGNKSRTGSGSVFRHQPTRLVSDTAGIAQRFGAHRPGPPLRGFLGGAVEALPTRRIGARIRIGLLLLGGCRFGGFGAVRGGDEVEEARGPVAGGST